MGWTSDQDALPLPEARHRMANAFQLLTTLGRLRTQRADDPETRRQVAWMLDAISALGVLQHRLLSPEGEDFAGFLHEIAPYWRRRAGDLPVSIEIKAEPVAVSEQSAAALAVIVQELVSNALAHAFPGGREGVVRVELSRLDDDRAVMVVADDGVGYAPAEADDRRLGLWLIRGLADQVRGVFSTRCDSGVTARLEFPTG
ncbi:MAG: sensor histidine kinase [Caulobacteraceae bacterium]|nr:sensor histidine kinase [Caulobacteraceae bacterium]